MGVALRLLFQDAKGSMREASKDAIDETMAECVGYAQSVVLIDFGNLQNSISIQETAHEELGGVTGRWGATASYAIYQEIGPSAENPHPWRFRPYLRPAADQEYPKLAGRIKGRLR